METRNGITKSSRVVVTNYKYSEPYERKVNTYSGKLNAYIEEDRTGRTDEQKKDVIDSFLRSNYAAKCRWEIFHSNVDNDIPITIAYLHEKPWMMCFLHFAGEYHNFKVKIWT